MIFIEFYIILYKNYVLNLLKTHHATNLLLISFSSIFGLILELNPPALKKFDLDRFLFRVYYVFRNELVFLKIGVLIYLI